MDRSDAIYKPNSVVCGLVMAAAYRCWILCMPRLLSFTFYSHASQDNYVPLAATRELQVSIYSCVYCFWRIK